MSVPFQQNTISCFSKSHFHAIPIFFPDVSGSRPLCTVFSGFSVPFDAWLKIYQYITISSYHNIILRFTKIVTGLDGALPAIPLANSVFIQTSAIVSSFSRTRAYCSFYLLFNGVVSFADRWISIRISTTDFHYTDLRHKFIHRRIHSSGKRAGFTAFHYQIWSQLFVRYRYSLFRRYLVAE
jgi:hypothetical protein